MQEDRLNLRMGRANEIADSPDLSDLSDIDIMDGDIFRITLPCAFLQCYALSWPV